jgi:hypothetical protein
MSANPRVLAAVAVMAITVAWMETLAMAASTESMSPEIHAALRAHTWLNAVYLCTVVVVAILTVLVWKSGNRVQEAIRKDAEEKKAASTIAQLTAEADKAREGIAKANALAAEATLKAEEERQRRLKLEAALAPRAIAAPGRTRKELKLFAGTRAFITYVDDSEARDLAQQVYAMLVTAEWTVVSMMPDNPPLGAQGVHVRTRGPTSLDRVLDDAAEILYFQLRDNNIEASVHTGLSPDAQGFRIDFPEDAVLIHIDPKPSSAVVAEVNADPLDEIRKPDAADQEAEGQELAVKSEGARRREIVDKYRHRED